MSDHPMAGIRVVSLAVNLPGPLTAARFVELGAYGAVFLVLQWFSIENEFDDSPQTRTFRDADDEIPRSLGVPTEARIEDPDQMRLANA